MTLGVGKMPDMRFETADNATFPTGGEEEKLEKELSKTRGYTEGDKTADVILFNPIV